VKSGASSILSYYADVDEDAVPGRTEQLFQLSYEIDNVNVNTSVKLAVDVLDYPDFTLTAENTTAKAGIAAELHVKVENRGSKMRLRHPLGPEEKRTALRLHRQDRIHRRPRQRRKWRSHHQVHS